MFLESRLAPEGDLPEMSTSGSINTAPKESSGRVYIISRAGLRLAEAAVSAMAPSPEYERPKPADENSFSWNPAADTFEEIIATAAARADLVNRFFWLMTKTSLCVYYLNYVTQSNKERGIVGSVIIQTNQTSG
ncbi:hypothetical protein D3C78_1327190 [compost metagenome]